jgi:hypothetical protein
MIVIPIARVRKIAARADLANQFLLLDVAFFHGSIASVGMGKMNRRIIRTTMPTLRREKA